MTKISKFKKRYEALTIPEQRAGEFDWVDRLRTWTEFVRMGKRVADLLEQLSKTNDPEEYHRQFRSLCPELHDLLMEAHGKDAVVKPWRKP